ncbi:MULTISPECIES: hypothetical protein [unclassified Cytobacillus]|uniref:hypothetical protein n=1 Tax=unclassified Cytobacillus TaxID=2675268 RepID=UPI002040E4E2|nr:hypothetical protein [Cytobacillus sp. AMY 15.2]MCM3089949.1 hypothetical protein [Cytobacillus sp. AMY 15.2]
MFWKKKEPEIVKSIAWFSYSIMLPEKEEDEEDIMAVGNLNISNIGTAALNNPLICLRTKPSENVRLGGKIGSVNHTALMIDGSNTEAWVYIDDDWKEKALSSGEHWLKPSKSKALEQGTNLNFGYELQVSSKKKDRFVLVEGFFYCDEQKDGISALNSISINF